MLATRANGEESRQVSTSPSLVHLHTSGIGSDLYTRSATQRNLHARTVQSPDVCVQDTSAAMPSSCPRRWRPESRLTPMAAWFLLRDGKPPQQNKCLVAHRCALYLLATLSGTNFSPLVFYLMPLLPGMSTPQVPLSDNRTGSKELWSCHL